MTPQSSGTNSELSSVFFIDVNLGWAVGFLGTILKATDGGSNWTSQSSVTTAHLVSVFFTDSNTGWVVGSMGTILKTTTGGATFIEEEDIDEIPNNYKLIQNYPNPFNSSTKIKYSIPQSSNVVIKVFDVLGNDLETLVNEKKPTGSYEITWYAESLPSGVYFYRLQAVSFVETKKMVLLK